MSLTRRARRGCNDPHGMHVFGDRLFVFRSEHAHLGQLHFQRFEAFIQRPHAILYDLFCIELVFPVPLIDTHRAEDDHLMSFLHPKGESRP